MSSKSLPLQQAIKSNTLWRVQVLHQLTVETLILLYVYARRIEANCRICPWGRPVSEETAQVCCGINANLPQALSRRHLPEAVVASHYQLDFRAKHFPAARKDPAEVKEEQRFYEKDFASDIRVCIVPWDCHGADYRDSNTEPRYGANRHHHFHSTGNNLNFTRYDLNAIRNNFYPNGNNFHFGQQYRHTANISTSA